MIMNIQELKQYIDRVLGNNIRCLLPSYWWKRLFGEIVDNIDSISKSTKNSIDRLTSKVKNTNLAIDITYEELYRKRENSELVPGQSYRIIDYECTINDNDPDLVALSPEDSRFERFCIVVTALTNNQLSENASATMDSMKFTYGIDDKTSWEIKYSLLNNTAKYPWARVGSKSYDVATLFLPDGNSTNKPGCFYWDKNSQKYIAEGFYDTYLVTSLTDKTPLPQTTFNYGDTLYILWGTTIVEAVACYTDSMKDTGDAVLVNNKIYNYPFVWNPSLDNYYCPINDESYYTFYYGGKRDSFNSKESLQIMEATKTYINGEISNGELFVLFGSGTECLKIEWNSSENRYLGTIDSNNVWLCESANSNTPITQTTFNIGDTVHLSDSNSISKGIVCYTGADNTTDRLMFKASSFNIYFCMQFDNAYKLISYNDGEIKINHEIYLVDTNTKLPLDKIDNIIEGESVSISTLQLTGRRNWNTVGFFVPDGKGVIYYLKDHNNNEAFYDFKNILFRFPEIDENPRFTFHGETNYDGEDLNTDYSIYSSNTKIDKPDSNRINKVSLYYSTDGVVVSGKVYNTCLTVNYNYKHIGLDSNNNLTIINIHDYLSKIEQLNQDLIDDEKVTAFALLDLNKRKQDILVSGKNIKTYNGESILGEGNIINVPDNELNEESNNTISNKAVSAAINELRAGTYTFEYNSDETNVGLLMYTIYAFLVNNDNSFANFAHNIFIRPIGTENAICFVTGIYTDENKSIVVEYVYKGKCWKRIASESGDSFEDVEIV